MMEARIGGVMVLAESAGQRSGEDWALLIGAVCAALVLIGAVEWLTNRSRR